jgi:hypothetical protein
MACRLFSLSLVAAIAFAGCARDPTVITGDRPIAGGHFEASGVVAAANGRGVLLVDDDDPEHVLWMAFDATGTPRPAVPVPTGARIIDPEGMTTDGRFTYVVASQSKIDSHDGDDLVRFVFDADRVAVQELTVVRNLRTLLAAEVEELQGVDRRTGDRALNIEAIAWDPAGSQLLLGLRAPLAGSDALVVPLKLRDPSGPFAAANLHVPGGSAWHIPLGGAGIRSLEYDPRHGTFRIVTGAHLDEERLAFRLLEWPAGQPASIRELAIFPRGLKPEGIAPVHTSEGVRTMIVYDSGRFLFLD